MGPRRRLATVLLGTSLVALASNGADALITVGHAPGFNREVEIVGSLAYLAAQEDGLRVLDVSDPRIPLQIGALATQEFATGIDVEGEIAYVTDNYGGLRIIDISEPTAPTEVGRVATSGRALAVVAVEQIAYLVDDLFGLRVLDVSTPAAPVQIGAFETFQPQNVTIVGSLAYLGLGFFGLNVLDISDPTSPALLVDLVFIGEVFDVAVVGNLAYVAAGDAGLRIFDASDPTALTQVGLLQTGDPLFELEVIDGLAYVADLDGTLHVIDVSNPASPQARGQLSVPGPALDVDVDVGGALAWLAGDGGLRAIDLSNLDFPKEVGSLEERFFTLFDAELDGDFAYVAQERAGLAVIDVSDPVHPAKVATLDTPGFAVGLDVAPGFAYVADFLSGMRVVDVSDPVSPVEVGVLATTGFARDLEVEGETVYLADGRLNVIDVSSPAAPVLLSAIATLDAAQDVDVEGSLAFVADVDGLQVIDVSNPTAPVALGALPTPRDAPNDVEVARGVAYLAESFSGLELVDVTDPRRPVQISRYAAPPRNTSSVEVVGSLAYVGDAAAGVRVLDVSDPSSPVELGAFFSDSATDVEVRGRLVYLADLSGLRIIDFGPEYVRLSIGIDVKPGAEPNSIQPRSRGLIPVAILGQADFDVSEVDLATVSFGVGAAAPIGAGSRDDIDEDGFSDLVLHFRTQESGIGQGDREVCLHGELEDETGFEGCDSVRTVGRQRDRSRARPFPSVSPLAAKALKTGHRMAGLGSRRNGSTFWAPPSLSPTARKAGRLRAPIRAPAPEPFETPAARSSATPSP